jgi:hypothetical protein
MFNRMVHPDGAHPETYDLTRGDGGEPHDIRIEVLQRPSWHPPDGEIPSIS